MRPPDADAEGDPTVSLRVRAWCEGGAFATPTLPMHAASIGAASGLDAAASDLDGSRALARMPRWRGLAWRVQLQLRERWPGHRPRPTDPWDCGWWRKGAIDAVLAFRPRRPTLLLVSEPNPDQTRALLAALQSQCSAYQRPLRVLVVTQSPLPELPHL